MRMRYTTTYISKQSRHVIIVDNPLLAFYDFFKFRSNNTQFSLFKMYIYSINSIYAIIL